MEIYRIIIQQAVSLLPDGPELANPSKPDWAEVGCRDGRSGRYSCYVKASSPDTLSGSFETTSAHMDAV